MSSKLLNNKNKSIGTRLLKQEPKFRIVFEVKLDNKYEVKDMTQNHVKEFHRFLNDTVYKGLTISEVDKLYLRKTGLSNAPIIISNGKELLHYGKAGNPFRIFGYYNSDAYFVICRIDGSHKTNKE